MDKEATIAFAGTKEQEQELLKVIEKYRNMEGALIPVLHDAQLIYGYLPIEVQQIISDELGVPMAEIYGVVTFYSQFTMKPKGKYKIAVCMGTACYVKGSQQLIERIQKRLGVEVDACTPDGKFSLDATRCIGACGLAPLMTVNDHVYGRLVPEEVDSILDQYIND